jgi:TolB protein
MAKILSIVFILVFQSGIVLADFSPDGKKIVFSSNVGNGSQIFISNADGKNSKRISLEGGSYFNPVWSPLGDMIAFEKIEGGKSYVGVMSTDGSNERMLITGHKVENPSWTNDGEKILFYKIDEQGNVELFIIDLTGFNERLIISNLK